MNIINAKTTVFGVECTLELMDFDINDRKRWKELFDDWIKLKAGMREYKSREPNIPEGLSEVAFCLYSGSKRMLRVKGSGIIASSFDTFNIERNKAEQIKATSVAKDLTSFGPKSKWDDLYFLDFYNEGKLDGKFNVFLIPNELLYAHNTNALQTFVDQQNEKRRPRLSIANGIIMKHNIAPIATNVQVW